MVETTAAVNVCPYCGGEVVDGNLWNGRFIAGETDIALTFKGHEKLLIPWFGNEKPVRGEFQRVCSRCFRRISN